MPKGVYKHKPSSRFIDLSGLVFGKLTAIERVANTSYNATRWKCLCECGIFCERSAAYLRNGRATHCGCSKPMKKKGQSLRPEYSNWDSMIRRCTKPDASHFYLYGGRGIKVCEQWLNNFWKFLEDVGPKPSSNHSLDRINTNGNYEPGNVRWATHVEQSNNRRPQPKRTNFREYQIKADVTASYPGKGELGGIIYCGLGASAEMGELCNKLKKVIRDRNGEFSADEKAKIMDEIGDCLWYLSQLCTELEIDFSHVPVRNLEKLASRYTRGTISGSGDNR